MPDTEPCDGYTNWAAKEMCSWLENDEAAYLQIQEAQSLSMIRVVVMDIATAWRRFPPNGLRFTLEDFEDVNWEEVFSEMGEL